MPRTARHDEFEPPGPRARWLALLWPDLLLGGLTLAGALVIGNVLRDHETRALEAATATANEAVVSELEDRMLDQVRALERLAANWKRRKGLPRAEFEAEAGQLARDFSHLQGIGWVDPEFVVRWVVPRAGNEAAEGFDLGFDAARRATLEAARDEHEATISQPRQIVQGGLGLAFYAPLDVDGRFDGFVSGLWRPGDLFAGLLRNVAPEFGIRILDGAELIYARGDTDVPWRQERVARVPSAAGTWSIEVAPLPPAIETYKTRMPLVVVIAGAALALTLTLTAHLARLRRLRNRHLSVEVGLRRAAEEKLKAILDEIPDHVWSGEFAQSGFQTTFYSPAIAKITGRPAETYEGSLGAWHEIVHEDDRENLQRAHREVLTGQRPGFKLEYRIRRADGTLAWVADRVHATPTDRGLRLDGVTSDITEAKHNQAKQLLYERERLLVQERERMTREMHDGLGGQLVSAISMLELGNSSSKEVTESLRMALDEMRIVLDNLDPRTSELTTSLGKLRSRIAPLMKRNGIQLRWQVEDVPGLDGFSPEQSLHLLRIIQEAVTNCVRHAKAHEVRVRLRGSGVSEDRLSLEISDDGCGFDLGSVHGGRGTRNIKSRAVALEAELRIESDDSGTRIQLDIPLPPQQSMSSGA